MVTPSPAPSRHRGLALKSQLAYGRFEVVDRQYFDAREDSLAHKLCDTFSPSVNTVEMRLVARFAVARKTTHPHRSAQPDYLSRERKQEVLYQWCN